MIHPEKLSAKRSFADSLPSAKIFRLLAALTDASLVVYEEGADGVGRYRLLEMTRQYAQERQTGEEKEETERRHADYFFAEALTTEADGRAHETAFTQQRRMWPDQENYYAALGRLRPTDSEKGVEMMLTLDSCRIWRHLPQDEEYWIHRLETQPLPPPSPLQARLYIQVGAWALHRSRIIWKVLMERGFLLADGCDDDEWRVRAALFLCEFDITGNTAQARERLERCMIYAARTQNSLLKGQVQSLLFRLYFLEKNFDAARRIAEALLHLGRENAYWSIMTRALEALAELASARQDYARARDYLEQALILCPKMETHSRSNILREIGDAASRQGDYVAAREALQESLTLCRTHGHQAHEGWSYHGLAYIAYRQGQKTEAIEWQNKALHLFDEIGEEWSVVTCLKGMAQFFEDRPERAAFFWSAYERFSGARVESFPENRQEEIDAAFMSLRIALSEDALTALRQEAASLTLREIVQRDEG